MNLAFVVKKNMSDHKQRESIKAMSHKALMDVITRCKAACKMMEM